MTNFLSTKDVFTCTGLSRAMLDNPDTLSIICAAVARAASSGATVELSVDIGAGVEPIEIRRDLAIELIAAYLDSAAAEARRVSQTRERPLRKQEKWLLRWLNKFAPARFTGLRLKDGRRVLQPLSAIYTECDKPVVWVELSDELAASGVLNIGPERDLADGVASFTAELSTSPALDPDYFSKLARLDLLNESLKRSPAFGGESQ